MIIWSGYGYLVPLLFFFGLGAGFTVDAVLRAASVDLGIGGTLGLAAAAVAIWKVGSNKNSPVNGFHPETGQPVVYSNRHTLFWIPMQYWAIGPALLGGMSVLALIANIFV